MGAANKRASFWLVPAFLTCLLASGAAGSAEKKRGELGRDEIHKVVHDHLDQVVACYTRHHPDMTGWLTIGWTIDAQGEVIRTVVQRSTSGKAALAECVMAEIRSWRFPKPRGGGEVEVSYPFHFHTVGF
jgi:TonB family protein